MKSLRGKPGNWRIFLLLLTMAAGALAMTFPGPLSARKEMATKRPSLNLPPMCAPLSNRPADATRAMERLAPELATGWDARFPITTVSKAAQQFFNQGLFYLYAFNHAEAVRSFKEAARLDPACAMCYWGTALALGPNINRPMPEENYGEAYTLSRKALQLSRRVSGKEAALIAALSERYRENPPEDRRALDLAYADAMRRVYREFREDPNVGTLFAESLMGLVPWDYWLPGGTPKPETEEMHEVLSEVLKTEPGHPGANHYYIHSVEAVHPELAVLHADRLKELAYPAGHLVHMPSHIYVRLGRYHEASEANQKAIALDEDYIERCQAQGFYPILYYPHNLHFLWFATSMEGRGRVSIEAARKLAAKVSPETVAEAPGFQRYYTIPLFALLRFGKWEEILNEPRPDKKLEYLQTIWHYARGMAYAKKGNLKKAQMELNNVEKGMNSAYVKALDHPSMPALGMSRMAWHILQAEIEGQNEDYEKKVEHLREAVGIQDGFIYMEPPYFYFPVRQALGAALLEAGRPAEAEKAYRQELESFPGNGWSLFGLYQSLLMQNKSRAARQAYKDFESAWREADVILTRSAL